MKKNSPDAGIVRPGANSLRVLIVEDEALVSLFLAEALQDLGHEVVGSAASRNSALQLAAATAPDLALVDIGLIGEGDGIEVAIKLRERHDVPSLLMTGTAHAMLQQRVGEARPLGYLVKPYTELDVERAMSDAFAWISHSARGCATADSATNVG